VTLEQIAEAADISPAQLARSFATKEAFVEYLLADAIEALFGPSEVPEGGEPPTSIVELQSILDRFWKTARTEAALIRLLVEMMTRPESGEISRAFQAMMERMRDRLVNIILRGQQEGVIRRSIDAEKAAWEWLNYCWGYALLRPLEIGPPPEAGNPLPLVDCLLHGLLKTDV
jgi:AcrR family transcriptional regulator